MIREELYHKTVGILVDAYFKDTLVHGNCKACAVGNIVAANRGIGLYSNGKGNIEWEREVCTIGVGWASVFSTDPVFGGQSLRPDNYDTPTAKEQIDATGYQWQELAKIEYAFESAPKATSDEDWMFNGLMAVIEVLDQIHENTDPVVQQQSKARFLKTA